MIQIIGLLFIALAIYGWYGTKKIESIILYNKKQMMS